MFPERFANLPPYAFPRLRALLDPHSAGGPVVHMTIGEPRHAFPAWIADILSREIAGFGVGAGAASIVAIHNVGWPTNRGKYCMSIADAKIFRRISGFQGET